MEKLIPTLQVLNSLSNPVLFTVLDGVLLMPLRANSIEDFETAQDALRDADIDYVWHENKIIINPELF